MKSGITWCPEYERILYYIQSTKTHLLPAIIFHKYIDLLKSFSQYINKYEICILTHWNFVAVAMYIHSQKKTTQSYSSGGTQLLVERGEPMHVNYTDYLKLLRWWPWNGSSISDTCIVALYVECMMIFVYMYICAWILINCLLSAQYFRETSIHQPFLGSIGPVFVCNNNKLSYDQLSFLIQQAGGEVRK